MYIAEEAKLVNAITPVDLQTGANDGDWVSMKNFEHISIVIQKGIGTAGDDPIVTLEQATAVAGTSGKALDFDKVWTNLRLDLTASDAFTRVASASIPRSGGALNTFLDLTSAELMGFIIIELDASELDVSNGFDCLRVTVSDVGGNAGLGGAFYLLSNPRYNSGLTNTTAITN